MESKSIIQMGKVKKEVTEESVKVVVRCRPLSHREIKNGNEKIVKIHPEKGIIELINPKREITGVTTKQFTFDTVYDESAKQTDLYDESFRPLVESVLMGFNGTIFAYGQTGAGKTFTMEGDPSDREKRGVIPNAFEHIFSHIQDSENVEYLVSASYLEIYQEEIRDLLSETTVKTCEVRQKPGEGAYVKDLTVRVCRNKADLENALFLGKKNRSIGSTNMNVHSSRSHAIFMLTIEQCELQEQHMKIGKLNLVDLAGSERQSKTGAMGQRQKESIKINLSLSALGNVISALVDSPSSHIPYRDSKLTRLLQDSLGGNAKTVMVANIGPAEYNYDETLTTLRYANRAKNIKNTPVVNEDPKDALLKQYKAEIERLKAELAAKVKKRKKRRKTKLPENDSGGITDEDDVEDEEEMLRQKEEMLKEERTVILNDQHMIAEEKERLLNEVKEQEELLTKENQAKQSLLNKIKSMEGQLLSGGKNIIDHTNKQQKQLEQQKKELAEQKCREREIIRKLEEEEETTVEIKETYSTLRQEVEIKTKKLKKLFLKLQSLKREIYEEQEINSRERQEKERIQDALMRQLKYTHLVIENFVPPEDKAKILKRVQYDEDENLWFYLHEPKNTDSQPVPRPTSADGKTKRPICDFAKRMWKLSSSARYASENVAMIDLDFAALSVSDYEPPDIDPVHRALMDGAFSSQRDLEIDASDPKFRPIKKSARRRCRVKTARRKQKDEEEEDSNYPTPRGLVPRH